VSQRAGTRVASVRLRAGQIGRTLAINPGSEYSEGVLRGAIITLSRKKGVRGHQLVVG
jgi:Icc-related predicted phosphoesterase